MAKPKYESCGLIFNDTIEVEYGDGAIRIWSIRRLKVNIHTGKLIKIPQLYK